MAKKTFEGKEITESMGIHKEWYRDAEKQTLQTLPEFLEMLFGKTFVHDYGTICHAIAAAAVAAANAGNHSAQGGITGFQAGAIGMEFFRHWNGIKGPFRVQRLENLLFPQYSDEFKRISADVAEWLVEEAREKLATSKQSDIHPEVWAHWIRTSQGVVPFGLGKETR